MYVGEGEVLLIDSKQDAASAAQGLAEIGKLTPHPVRYLVSTHADGDHVYGNRFQPGGITIIAHADCVPDFYQPSMRGEPSDWRNPELKAFLPSVTFTDRMPLTVGGGRVELWHFGVAHTVGDAVVYFPEARVAFIGDQVFVGRPQLIHAYKGGSALGHVANLERMLAALPAERFVSGHSPVLDRPGVERHIAAMQAMVEKIRGLRTAGKGLEAVQQEFAPAEAALVGVIYAEVGR